MNGVTTTFAEHEPSWVFMVHIQHATPTNMHELWVAIKTAGFNVSKEVFQPLVELKLYALHQDREDLTQYYTPLPWLLSCLCPIAMLWRLSLHPYHISFFSRLDYHRYSSCLKIFYLLFCNKSSFLFFVGISVTLSYFFIMEWDQSYKYWIVQQMFKMVWNLSCLGFLYTKSPLDTKLKIHSN